jgi:hypothetical protein
VSAHATCERSSQQPQFSKAADRLLLTEPI